MVNLKDFLDEFKKTLSDPGGNRLPRKAYFVIEFLRHTSKGERELYSPLLVVGFLGEDRLHFHYAVFNGVRKSLRELAKDNPSSFSYLRNWDVVELVPPMMQEKMIVRIRPN